MTSIAATNFLNTVVSGFIDSRSAENPDLSPHTWMHDHLLNAQSPQTDVDDSARKILLDFHSSIPRNDSKRYQFRPLKPEDELLKVIFSESFYHAPEPVIREAQRIEGSFYPLSKRVCLIYIPKTIGAVFGNFLVKLALSVAMLYYTYKVGNASFQVMEHALTARAIPFFINHTPIIIIRSGNHVLSTINGTLQHKWKLLIGTLIIQQLTLRVVPRIPYFTATIDTICNIVWALFNSSQTLWDFLYHTAWDTAKFTWGSSSSLGTFFNSIAIKAESERLAIARSKSYAVWKKVIAENTPPHL